MGLGWVVWIIILHLISILLVLIIFIWTISIRLWSVLILVIIAIWGILIGVVWLQWKAHLATWIVALIFIILVLRIIILLWLIYVCLLSKFHSLRALRARLILRLSIVRLHIWGLRIWCTLLWDKILWSVNGHCLWWLLLSWFACVIWCALVITWEECWRLLRKVKCISSIQRLVCSCMRWLNLIGRRYRCLLLRQSVCGCLWLLHNWLWRVKHGWLLWIILQLSILSGSRRSICHIILLCCLWGICVLLIRWHEGLRAILLLRDVLSVVVIRLVGMIRIPLVVSIVIRITVVTILLMMTTSWSIPAASSFHIVIIFVTFRLIIIIRVLHLIWWRMSMFKIFPVICIEQACWFNLPFSSFLAYCSHSFVEYIQEIVFYIFFLASRKYLFIFQYWCGCGFFPILGVLLIVSFILRIIVFSTTWSLHTWIHLLFIVVVSLLNLASFFC